MNQSNHQTLNQNHAKYWFSLLTLVLALPSSFAPKKQKLKPDAPKLQHYVSCMLSSCVPMHPLCVCDYVAFSALSCATFFHTHCHSGWSAPIKALLYANMTFFCTKAVPLPCAQACTNFLTLARNPSDAQVQTHPGFISPASSATCSRQWFLIVKLNNLAALCAFSPSSTITLLYWLQACWNRSRFWPVSLGGSPKALSQTKPKFCSKRFWCYILKLWKPILKWLKQKQAKPNFLKIL